jgi:DNA-binding MarR family transcriptional regulator
MSGHKMDTDECRPMPDRDEAIDRYLWLRPIVRARLIAQVSPDLQEECESLTAHQLRALLLLPEDGLSMRQLAAALDVMGATVTVLADRLVAQGLAVRLPDPADRRVVRLTPTERGRALSSRAADRERRSAAEIFAMLSDAQVAAFLDVMETLAAGSPGTPRPASTREEKC